MFPAEQDHRSGTVEADPRPPASAQSLREPEEAEEKAMAVFHPHTVRCACGNTLSVQLADSINVKRSPESRERILRGELHRVACTNCGRRITVEKPFYYTDFARNALFKVLPRGERHTWKQASIDLDTASNVIPEVVADAEGRTLRVIFGMDDLREKLVAQDASIDDRILELLKVLLVYEHPILVRRPRLRLVLEQVTDADLEFVAAYEHAPQRFRLRMPRDLASDLANDPQQLQKWTGDAHRTSLFELKDHWVNMWRWSPQPTALDRLRAYAEAVTAGQAIDTTEAAFQQMLSGVPRGSHLPSWAKQSLRVLFEYAKKKRLAALEDDLFEIRFGIELEDDWSVNSDKNDIDTLWQLLKDLPDTNVEGNTKIHELLLDVGEGGGLYDPNSHDISIGSKELAVRERFEDVVRHEVGHAVHEAQPGLVNGWLEERFGWRIFGSRDDADIDQWVGLMGGWGALTASQQRDVRKALRTALGDQSGWDPGPTPALPPGHPWYGARFGPRLAFEKTGSNWYQNFQTWHRTGGKAFYLNYWYKTLMVVDVAALDLVKKMPDAYAAMSHFEFFAELYALYYDLDDPKRSVIPEDVRQWLDAHIGQPEPGAPRPSAPAAKGHWETTTRPEDEVKKKTAGKKSAAGKKTAAKRGTAK